MVKPNNTQQTARTVALNWLIQVAINGRSINEILLKDNRQMASQQQALAKQLLFGSLRYFHQLQTITEHLLEKPFKQKDADLAIIIILGLYQLKYLSTPDHAAISESVELTRVLNKPWAAGLVNGVLRNFQRDSAIIEADLSKSLQFQFSHPGWIVKKLKQDWPQEYRSILTENNQHAPMTLRINTQKVSRAAYMQALALTGVNATAHQLATDAVVLEKAVDVGALPGFTEGQVTVQDAAAQLAIEMLDLQPEQLVLDACAAPGGKTTHILQRQPRAKVIAVEMSSTRLERIRQTLQRMGNDCQLICADVSDIESWWDGRFFDRILVDAPCSASGVIRRNPDIKIHRKVTDVQPLQKLQLEILQSAWKILKPGGILVYATCSIFKQENQSQIESFMQQVKATCCVMPVSIQPGLSVRASVGYQIFPGELSMDGFYFCGLIKNS